METQNKPKWYKRKISVVSMVVGGIVVLALASSNSSPATTSTYVPVIQSAITHVQDTTFAPSSPDLSNSNDYVNTSGNTVHSPAYTSDNSVPAGATAQCRDGTYSFSQHRSGTCSHHGGVASWL